MTTAEQDIEMYMRVYAAAVTGLLSRPSYPARNELLSKANGVANDSVKALAAVRSRLETDA